MRAHTLANSPLLLPSVLIVDGDSDSRELYSLMLSDVAHDIQVAGDGRIALAKLMANPPSLLITDMRVPFIDGFMLCQLVRADPALARVPIILIASDASMASSSGADAVLVKPFSIGVFVTTVRMVVGGR